MMVCLTARFQFISEGNTFILHFAFSILHLPEGQKNDNFLSILIAQTPAFCKAGVLR